MKTKIKFSLILLLLCLFAVPSYAQEKKTVLNCSTMAYGQDKTTVDKLMSTVWKFSLGDKYIDWMKFEKDSVIEKRLGHVKPDNGTMYYLSDKIEEEFDSTKVGKTTDGKYLIMPGQSVILLEDNKTFKMINTFIKEIIELSDKELILQPYTMQRPKNRYTATDENPWD